MNQTGHSSGIERVSPIQLVTMVLAVGIVALGLLVKLDRVPSFGELILDPIRLMVPIALLSLTGIRRKLGVTRRFAMVGIACVGLTILSEALRLSLGGLFLIPAFALYVWMLGHCWKNRGVDSGWAGLALCLIMAPVF